MSNVSGALGKASGVGTVTNPGPWVVYPAGATAYCPAPTGPGDRPCNRRLRDVGAGVVFSVRVRAYQGLDKPMKGTTTQACPKCSTVLECKEEHV